MKNLFILLLLTLFLAYPTNEIFAESLGEKLSSQDKLSSERTPEEKRKIMLNAIQELRGSDIITKAPRVGDTIPDGEMLNAKGQTTTLYKAMAGKAAIITFYRGGWCPYCSLQLHAYQDELTTIKSLGAELVAISPEKPESALDTVNAQGLEFPVLSDIGNAYAKKLGIVFALDDDLKKVYQEFGIDLAKNNNTEKWELPLAATFVVNAKKQITYVFIDVDYKKRAETSLLIEELRKVSQ